MLEPIYGESLKVIRHPHYRPMEWGYANHYWIYSERLGSVLE